MLLIDSSAIVKFFSKEPGWEEVTKYINSSLTLSFAIVELSSGLLKKVIKKELQHSVAEQLINGYSESAILLSQNKYISTALNIAIINKLAIYDSLFIAVALDESYDLVSSDKKQLRVAKSLGIKTIRC